ncbi:22_t:CDS:2, partial [Diversispora eburnea]
GKVLYRRFCIAGRHREAEQTLIAILRACHHCLVYSTACWVIIVIAGKNPLTTGVCVTVVAVSSNAFLMYSKMGHRKYFEDVDMFWNQFEASSSVIRDTTEVFKNSLLSINSSINNMNNTMVWN